VKPASKRLLAVSLVANVILAVVLGWYVNRASARVNNLCATVRGDLDFLIQGLEHGSAQLYGPLVVRPLQRSLTFCHPRRDEEIAERAKYLRVALGNLVADNTPPELKETARRDALRILHELRAFE